MAKKARRVNYKKLVPEDSFLGRYMQYSETSETPYAYDFWTGIFTLSTALGRGVVVARGDAAVHLNMFAVLVAESGITRKSTAVRRAVKFCRVLCSPSNPLIEGKVTPEVLEYRLANQSKDYGRAYTTIMIDEMVKFLGREKYVETMPTLLTDLYDCPELRCGAGTLSRGETRLENVYVNFLSASTPSWLIRAVNPDVIEGGFTSRVIFVVCEEPKKSNPWPEASDEELYKRCTSDLERIKRDAERFPKIQISAGARSRFTTWYRSRDKYRDPFRASFQSREDAHVLRLAALLSINDGTWEIQAGHLLSAIKVITECREDGAAIFEGTGSGSKMILGIDALRDKLLAAGLNGAVQTELTKAMQRHMNAEHMKTALSIMHELGYVQKFEGVQLGRGRPATVWRGTKLLQDSRALDKILEHV